MDLIKKAYSAKSEELADRQVRVIVSTGDVDRSGEIIIPDGIRWEAYMATGAGPVLWNHNQNMPIAKCVSIERQGNSIVALVQFPPEGQDADSDKVYGRVKFGSVPGVSIGFQPVSSEPLDKGNPVKGPQRYLASDMMEFSFTPVPCNPSAVVVDKSARVPVWKVGASRNLAIGKGQGDDILDHADFDSDSPDTVLARKGFLAYDASRPDARDAYVLPFAKMINGHPTVDPDLLNAAKSGLETAGLPDEVVTKARAVIEHYEGKMSTKPSIIKAGATVQIKSLNHVAELARILSNLSWLEDCMEWDCMYGGDEASLPGILGEGLQALGSALISMTQAEVAALTDDQSEDETEAVIKGVVSAGASPMVKALIMAHIKAGRKFSASSITTMQEACKAIKEGHDAIAALMDETDSSDMGPTDASATADTVKAMTPAKVKRLRELEVLRLKTAI
ncbi:HK97 family phage prohead protease [Rhizobium oryzicola]|uniref:HK97 family phage prohead protease n=1 Tax=Rhizobium oryzicola TaxID=1232668 RepID=A0ABT8SVS3_9HYPH|nr:HK97 family phage prohead protease [Rhizobium oryzicola]MDO1582421.1 HK97 family phage prohead protease [Rhizobium oryzicola]